MVYHDGNRTDGGFSIRRVPSKYVKQSKQTHERLMNCVDTSFGPLEKKASDIAFVLLAQFSYMVAGARTGESASRAKQRLQAFENRLKRLFEFIGEVEPDATAFNALNCAYTAQACEMESIAPAPKRYGLQVPEAEPEQKRYPSLTESLAQTVQWWLDVAGDARSRLDQEPSHSQIRPEVELVRILAEIYRAQAGEAPKLKHDRVDDNYYGSFFDTVAACFSVLEWEEPKGKNIENYLKN